MKPSTNPAVWRAAVASIVAALITAGVLSPEWGDRINGWAATGAVVAVFLLPIVSALWAKMHTAPVAAGTPAAKVLVRGPDGVYAAATGVPVSNAQSNLRKVTTSTERKPGDTLGGASGTTTYTTGGYEASTGVAPPD